MEKYRVLTNKSILDIDTLSDENTLAFIEEQNAILKQAGFEDLNSQAYIIRFHEGAFRDEYTTSLTIADAVQCLAIKEGYDVVQFENGNIGYVSYYNNYIDSFEILTIDTEDYI